MAIGTVIVVPGIGGSSLTTHPTLFGFGPGVTVWLHSLPLISGGWRLLGLMPDGVTPNVPLTGRLIPGPPLGDYYGTLTGQLERLGWRVISPAMDWRLKQSIDASDLAELLESEGAEQPVHMIAHSRGGLVARRALELLRGSGKLDRVGRVAGLGVPHQGSWFGAGMLAGWAETVRLLEALFTATGPSFLGRPYLGTLLEVITTWPAPYELLPRPGAPRFTTQQAQMLYNAASWSAISLNVSQSWLSHAQSWWATLPVAPAAVEWVDVIGLGLPTPVDLLTPHPPAREADMLWPVAGDGTVPAIWAGQDGRLKVITPTSHSALVTDGRIVEVLNRYFREGLSQDVVIPGPVLR